MKHDPINQAQYRLAVEHAALPPVEFRRALRAFIETNFPDRLREGFHHPMGRIRGADGRQWIRTVFDHGWRAPHWPQECGGMGLSIEKQIIYIEEMDRFGVTRPLDFGGLLIGPTLIKFGTEAQKRRYLPRILNGDDIWAQGFSEPNSGSDLASLTTRAERVGDRLVINGSKIWTTQAADADLIFMLVRTRRLEKRQLGISFVLANMKTTGISLRPIQNIVGEIEFYQTFFDNVEIPVENVVGDLDQGWTVAKSLLGAERLAYGQPIPARRALDMAIAIAKDRRLNNDGVFNSKVAVIAADIHDALCLYDQVCERLIAGGEGAANSDLSMLKVYCTELHQRASDLVVEIAGDYAGLEGKLRIDDRDQVYNIGRLFSWVRAPTIFGGSSEIQRNILSKEILQ